MKKVLLTSTALVAFAGAANAASHAGVSLSGYAEMGIAGGSDKETQFHHDLDVKFSLVGTSDAGFDFGATIDLDEVSNGIGAGSGPHSVFISGDFGTLTMGDTDGAFDARLSEVGALTAIADDHTTHAGYNGNSGLDGVLGVGDGQILRYDYSFGDVTLSASAELDDNEGALSLTNPANYDPIIGLGISWSADLGGSTIGLGLGYQTTDYEDGFGNEGGADVIGLSVSGTISGITLVGNYSKMSIDDYGDVKHMGLSATYKMDALSITANWGKYDISDNGGVFSDGENKGYGIAVNYDLGGGAVIMAGYGRGSADVRLGNDVANGEFLGDTLSGDSSSTWSLGLGLSF